MLLFKRKAFTYAKLLDDEKDYIEEVGLLGIENKTVINESGLYALITISNSAEAVSIARWMTREFLPEVRRLEKKKTII